MKRKLSILTLVIVILLASLVPVYAAEPIPFDLYSDAALVLDMRTGEILYALNENDLRYPASTTKMMTCILALEMLDPKEIVTVDSPSTGIGGSSLNLKKDEQYEALDLITGTLVVSANDGAAVLAKHISGSWEEFVKLMNAKAIELGCTGTNFVNPHGLHDNNHYTTAADLAIIAQYCMKNETFRSIVCKDTYTLHPIVGKERTVENTNWLLNDTVDNHRVYVGNDYRYCKYDGCIGIKTGQTNKAGCCLVAAAERGNTSILIVCLHASDSYKRFSDAIKLLDLGFESVKTVSVMSNGNSLGSVAVKRGAVKSVSVQLDGDIFASIPSDSPESIVTTEVNLEEKVQAPVDKGQVLGSVKVYRGEQLMGVYDAIASDSVAKGGPLSVFGIDDATAHKIGTAIKAVIIIFLLLVLALAAYILYERRRIRLKKQRKAERMKAKAEAERKLKNQNDVRN